jgi:hypothetical protein
MEALLSISVSLGLVALWLLLCFKWAPRLFKIDFTPESNPEASVASWCLTVDEEGTMELPDELFTEHGWEVGDELDFQVSGEDGEKILVITNLSLENRRLSA